MDLHPLLYCVKIVVEPLLDKDACISIDISVTPAILIWKGQLCIYMAAKMGVAIRYGMDKKNALLFNLTTSFLT